jgi:hypothetical protein
MDPYLEAPDIWPDFHDSLAGEIRNLLNQTLPAPFYARLEMRPEIGIVEGGQSLAIVPDVSVVQSSSLEERRGGTAILDHPRTEISKSIDVTVIREPLRHHFVEVIDSSRGHKLITLIEILSPSNKRRGVDREAYEKKQREVFDSGASLIEIDLLRGGKRIFINLSLAEFVGQFEPAPDYLVLVNRVARVDSGRSYHTYPIGIRDVLPCIPVPLRPEDSDVPLDLQFVFNRAYEGGPYRRGAVNYFEPPEPPLREADVEWAAECLRIAQAAKA